MEDVLLDYGVLGFFSILMISLITLLGKQLLKVYEQQIKDVANKQDEILSILEKQNQCIQEAIEKEKEETFTLFRELEQREREIINSYHELCMELKTTLVLIAERMRDGQSDQGREETK